MGKIADAEITDVSFTPMTPVVARHIADAWHYPEPYDFYDITADADDLEEFVTPALWPSVFWQARVGDELVGFITATPDTDSGGVEPACEIALGMRPDLTGRGWGEPFLRAALVELARHLPGTRTWRLSVAAFNARAVTLYERVGFRVVAHISQQTNGGVHPFVVMELARSQSARTVS